MSLEQQLKGKSFLAAKRLLGREGSASQICGASRPRPLALGVEKGVLTPSTGELGLSHNTPQFCPCLTCCLQASSS